ncbi:hypothetical protein L596_016140 [Steinernema carpocapsae]|uniref:Chromatin target of PRMT1 protein C-terminal domain-containing protein n=1 Tax=Steinernema carpocapsae TaxID=34508 RepID=A0A4U5NH44_STECR|nr:hypothetical protein L596_016140 [Steinernema carpocapsae]
MKTDLEELFSSLQNLSSSQQARPFSWRGCRLRSARGIREAPRRFPRNSFGRTRIENDSRPRAFHGIQNQQGRSYSVEEETEHIRSNFKKQIPNFKQKNVFKRDRKPKVTMEELDRDLEAYMTKSKNVSIQKSTQRLDATGVSVQVATGSSETVKDAIDMEIDADLELLMQQPAAEMVNQPKTLRCHLGGIISKFPC